MTGDSDTAAPRVGTEGVHGTRVPLARSGGAAAVAAAVAAAAVSVVTALDLAVGRGGSWPHC